MSLTKDDAIFKTHCMKVLNVSVRMLEIILIQTVKEISTRTSSEPLQNKIARIELRSAGIHSSHCEFTTVCDEYDEKTIQ